MTVSFIKIGSFKDILFEGEGGTSRCDASTLFEEGGGTSRCGASTLFEGEGGTSRCGARTLFEGGGGISRCGASTLFEGGGGISRCGASTLFHLRTCVFYLKMVEWNDGNMLWLKQPNERAALRCRVCVDLNCY